MDTPLLIGLVSISDRASTGVYVDRGLPGLTEWFTAALKSPWQVAQRLIPDEQAVIEATLRELVDTRGCHLVRCTRPVRSASPFRPTRMPAVVSSVMRTDRVPSTGPPPSWLPVVSSWAAAAPTGLPNARMASI